MKFRSFIAILLALSLLLCGCSNDETEKKEDCVLESENFSVTEDMALYMLSYTAMMYENEFNRVNLDYSTPLSEQMRDDGTSYADYLRRLTVDNLENILLYCEAALKDGYTADEGMIYKANENITYLESTAKEFGLSTEEYITALFGEGVTIAGLETCTQMMTLCEGYEISLKDSMEVSSAEIAEYSGKNKKDFLKFDALRFTTVNKVFANELAASKNSEEFLAVMSQVSGIDLTDSDGNSIPDIIEFNDVSVSTDISGEFASRAGAAAGDTQVIENKNGSFTVTLLLNTPALDESPAWDFRLICITNESSTDPYGDASSLRDQWIKKKGKEKDFANIAARYSDHPSAYYGGRMSGITREEMPSESVAAWICASDRKNGDTTMAPGGDTSAYVLYYIDGNIPFWKMEATDALKSKKIVDKIDNMKDDIKKSFKFNEELMDKALDKYVEQLVAAQTANMLTD